MQILERKSLFATGGGKGRSVSTGDQSGWTWSWRTEPRPKTNTVELSNCLNGLSGQSGGAVGWELADITVPWKLLQ
jgi:hypothetical protein